MPLTGVIIFRDVKPVSEKPFVAVNIIQIISSKKYLIAS